ncbi:MAG: DoxX family protein [Aquisalimonadaceae bacterium]
MNITTTRGPAVITTIARLIAGAVSLFRYFPPSLTQLVLRIAVAIPFWRSGLTRWDGFLELSSGAKWLFRNEFQLHILGGQYPMPLPLASAYLSAVAEIVLPVMLVLGLGTRFAAFGLLIMTAVIQLTIPDAWLSHHLPWAAMLLAIISWGPGRVAVDQLLYRQFNARY